MVTQAARRTLGPPQAPRIDIRFRPQEGPQTAYLQSPFDVTVYGGARGGGKTYGSLGEFWLHAEVYGEHARGLMLRKTREDLKDTMAVASLMYGSAAKWVDKGSYYRFHNGARLYMAYLENEKDAEHYQGWSLTRVYIEELTQFLSPEPVTKLLATLRSSQGIRCQMRCTCNPGGPGHNWEKAKFIDPGPYRVMIDPESGISTVFIPALLTDNPALLESDPTYINRLKAVGSPQLIRAWLEGDWDIIEGAFFPEFERKRHVIAPFHIPGHWTKFRAADWGSARPFSIGWYAVVQDTMIHDGRRLPRGALVRYREWYGCEKPNVGLKMTATEVAKGIIARETNGKREDINYGVMDPAAFNVVSGPSIGEEMARAGAVFKRADNTRIQTDKKQSGWNQVRQRLVGDDDGDAMLFLFTTNIHLIRTLPVMQHDAKNPEDLDTDGEDHAVDELRYGCMSRPYLARIETAESKNPFLVSNAFRLKEYE